METTVKIKWDKPQGKEWLCADNIKLALHSYCINTIFDVEELNELTGSEAIYGFCGWLTGRKEKTVMSSKNDAACIADLIKQFCDTNNLTEPKDDWNKLLKFPK